MFHSREITPHDQLLSDEHWPNQRNKPLRLRLNSLVSVLADDPHSPHAKRDIVDLYNWSRTAHGSEWIAEDEPVPVPDMYEPLLVKVVKDRRTRYDSRLLNMERVGHVDAETFDYHAGRMLSEPLYDGPSVATYDEESHTTVARKVAYCRVSNSHATGLVGVTSDAIGQVDLHELDNVTVFPAPVGLAFLTKTMIRVETVQKITAAELIWPENTQQ